MKKISRGSLLMAMMVGTTGFLLAMVVAGISISQLNLTRNRSSRNEARNAAEAVIHLGVAEILHDKDFGVRGKPTSRRTMEWKSPDGASVGTLTFDPDVADHSSNGLGQDVPMQGWRTTVPVHCAQLVGKGKRADVECHVVVMLHVPPYPFALSSSGPFESHGDLLVGELPSNGDPSVLGTGNPDLSKLRPGNLGSRSTDVEAIKLAATDIVLGDVSAVGDIARASTTRIGGEVRPHDDVAPLPSLDIDSFTPPPAITETLAPATVAARPDALKLDGFCQSGALTVPHGLELDSGVLYVNGDLTVNGGIHGKGAIFCKGKVQINGGADLSADNQVALLAKGAVTMVGSGLQSNIQGVVYSEGNVTADHMSVTGALVANGGAAGEGGVTLTQAAAVSMPSLDFHAGWLAEKTWYYDMNTRQMAADKPGRDWVEVAARGVPNDSGGLDVKWELAFATGGEYNGRFVMRTDHYDASGQPGPSEVHVDLSPGDQRAIRLIEAFGYHMPAAGEDTDGVRFVLALIFAGINNVCDSMITLAQNQPPLTPQEVRMKTIRGAIDLDLNTFLGMEDKIRVLQWKEVWE